MCVCVCVFRLLLVLVGSGVRKHKNAEYTGADQRGEETSTEQHPGSRVSPHVAVCTYICAYCNIECKRE